MSALWTLRGVGKVFHEGAPNQCVALDQVDLEVEAGTWTVLRGPSGSGKTTLLAILGGLARPTTGRVLLEDRVLSALPEHHLTELRRRSFGFVFQQFHLIRGLSALENVEVPGVPTGAPRAERRARARELLAELGLEAKADQPVELLSGGEAQRVAVARALLNRPRAVLADEPTANLDEASSRQLLAQLARLRAEGTTVVLTSHDPEVWAHAGVDRVVALHGGRLADEAAR